MPGNAQGAIKTAAVRTGHTVVAYMAKVAAGLKWCTACKVWHPLAAFKRDRTRGDGLDANCLVSLRGQPHYPRDPAKETAHARVKYAVHTGALPRPDSLPCMDCGHQGNDRRHEYDHHHGYAPENWLKVQPVCTLCHAEREIKRREADSKGCTCMSDGIETCPVHGHRSQSAEDATQ